MENKESNKKETTIQHLKNDTYKKEGNDYILKSEEQKE